MNTSTENDNTNDPHTLSTKTVETVEKPKKQKRKFEWTPKRKEAFEKCVAARKNQIQVPKSKPKDRKVYSSSSSDTSVSSSSSEEKYKKPKRKGIKKQFYKLKKDLIYNMQKSLQKQTKQRYDNNDDDDYYYRSPSLVPSRQSVPEYTETYSQPSIPAPQPEKQPTPSTPKYCFL